MSDERDDELIEAITDAAEAIGGSVAFVYQPTPEDAKAAGDRLELAEMAICEASGVLPRALVEFNPTSRQRNNRWSDRQADPLWLLTAEELALVPDGTSLVSISGRVAVKGSDYIDDDTRGGYLAYGLLGSQLPPLPAPLEMT